MPVDDDSNRRLPSSAPIYRSLLEPTRFAQFLSIGVIGAIVDNSVLVLLVEAAALAPTVAAFGAKESSILLMFALNERWTFEAQSGGGYKRRLWRLVKSNAVRVAGASIGIATLYVLHVRFGIWYLAANVLGIGVGFLFNYTLEALVTWSVHTEDRSVE
ncbi:GtrA family protein [Halorubellus sp. JP-L1]|uniref:GtrA family protein n=1 Tax=Halorubellus sp. JP-L1 TaxID=2715753 RepID=UPI00140B7330|nr:GtrA family protein [Halorubellus sp. JP-L1]NHN42159.1 GtrA family protein [Halorubellus sp. JP-L1]